MLFSLLKIDVAILWTRRDTDLRTRSIGHGLLLREYASLGPMKAASLGTLIVAGLEKISTMVRLLHN